jgi:branched-chain amino acid transport system permease protein
MWGVMLGAVLIYLLQTVVLIHFTEWIGSIGSALHIDWMTSLSANVRLTDYTFFIYGIILVLFMLFRPEGLISSSRRKAELRPESHDIVEQEVQEVYDTREARQAEPDVKGGDL